MRINRRVLLFLVLLIAGAAAGGVVSFAADVAKPREDEQQAPETTVPPKLKRILKALDAANAEVQDVSAKVLYLREIPLLEQSEKSEGFLEFRKPDCLHLRLGKPRNEEFYSDGKQWWIVDHDEKQVEVYEAAGPEGVAPEASFLMFGYDETSEKLLEQYEITIVSEKEGEAPAQEQDATVVTYYRLRFVPREEDAPARFAAIEIELADDLWLPRVIVLHESDGEILHSFHLQEIELNRGLEEKRFTYKPPRGYAVLKP